jgi:hypothetical protein
MANNPRGNDLPRSKCCNAIAWVSLDLPVTYECDKCHKDCEVLQVNEGGTETFMSSNNVDEEIDKLFSVLNGSGEHACYCPRSVDNGCECALKDEYLVEAKAKIRTIIARQSLEIRMKGYESIHAIYMAHDWNDTSEDLKKWLTAEVHDIQRLQITLTKSREQEKQ